MRILRPLFCLCAVLQLTCDSGVDNSVLPDFAIYRLKDTVLTASEVWDRQLDELELSDVPLLTLDDVISYNWSTHTFKVTAAVDSQLVRYQHMFGQSRGIPFVIVAEHHRTYLGAFWFMYSSLMPQVPYIEVMFDPHRIWPGMRPQETVDKRNDERIYRVLKKAGILIE